MLSANGKRDKKMKYVYKVENLCCAHCAAKIEEEISKIEGVEKVNVNYLSEKIKITSDIDNDELFEKVKSIALKIEPDCTVGI